ncbi:hypothetical protein GGU11DRAFT_804767 [Lentinula aff. detonsa]|uniref:Uncharacterized protein n=1 Tax=Lentinula aff. detonsa TaxID=2804958 RepID=A0AA38NTH2_9AGAR|nr:hypothetical protein GGU10DRAFT_339636 [Lentinula aff. detonsa]KAJ3802960.1 hypothetical protein GGU11DRAFT_804767 [Lentinula aff. detonsa]
MSTSLYPVPPTTNELSPSQRLRLMRSTRKLGDMLGTTPVINSSSQFGQRPSASPRSSPTISLHHSSSVPYTHTQKKSKVLPRPLVLSLQSRPAPLSSSRSSDPTTPLSPTSISTNMASSSSNRDENDYQNYLTQTRRKRMAKLTRTLGENIPPELVFNSNSLPSRSRSSSVDASTIATFTVIVKDLPETHHSQESIVPVLADSPPIMKIMKPQSSSVISRSESVRTPSPSFIARRMMRKHRGHAKTSSQVQLIASPSGRKSSDTVRSTLSSYSTASEPSHTNEVKRTYRKQAGWSGEWNRQDMDEVMNRLRGLKAT